jgi:pimeloyl-ACP methyl ester carboxylesterase
LPASITSSKKPASPKGEAKILIFTHGAAVDYTMFEKQVKYFKSSCTVIVWDIPLHGRSRPYTEFSYKNAAEELNAILDRENADRVVLAGLSLGGYVCQHFALLYPNKVEGFVSIDSGPLGLSYYSKSDIWWLKKAALIMRLFPAGLLRSSMTSSASMTPYGREVLRNAFSKLDKATICQLFHIVYGIFQEENRDADFHFPVLLLMGDKDKTGKLQKYNRQWSENTGYPLKIIRNAGHLSNCDNPDDVNAIIAEFVEQL